MNSSSKTDRMSPEEWLAGLAMVGVMVVGGWQGSHALRSRPMAEVPGTLAAFRNGDMTGAIGTQFDKNLPWRSDIIAWANAGRYVLTRGAGDQVRLGRSGWLFSTEELQFHPDAPRHAQQRVALMAATARSLQAQGVQMLVALVPDKARVHAGHTASGAYPHWYVGRYAHLLAELGRAGVQTVDLRSVLEGAAAREEVYYRTDTHWNQQGAGLAAAAVAQAIRALVPGLPSAAFQTQASGGESQRVGDLLRMMGLADMPDLLRPLPDTEVARQTTRISQSSQPVGLFDSDAGMPVVLAGTSYALRANFHGQLQQALGAEVLNVSKDGAGFIQSMQEYLSNEAFATAKPQVLVWEVPERMFSAPPTPQELQPLLP